MKVLLTGASSFTGAWFARALVDAGYEVTATLRRSDTSYAGVRALRVEQLKVAGVTLVTSCSFGGSRFLDILTGGCDVLCHHAANVENYRSPDFDAIAALQDNTHQLRQVIERAQRSGLKGVVLTGSVFEPDEGAGTAPLRALSPYGLSKGLTWQVFRYWCTALGVPLHKFIIPNPFGPFEEARFCAYLMQRWVNGNVPQVSTPSYVRDNIHVSLLARAYAEFVGAADAAVDGRRLGPSGYVESQGTFANRFAAEIGPRLGLKTPLVFAVQTEFSEPCVRINTDQPDAVRLRWSETTAWDELATYYRAVYLRK